MRFELTDEQAGFARSLRDLLGRSDTVGAARAWIGGDPGPGLAIWKRLADQGVNALVVPEESGGMGGSLVDLCVAHEVLGHQLAVGPWIEASAYLATALTGEVREAVASGAVATVAVPPQVPRALVADVAEQVFVLAEGRLAPAAVGDLHASVDGTRRLFDVAPAQHADDLGGHEADTGADAGPDAGAAFDAAALACAAQLLGAGERILEDSVAYVKQRKQFGRQIGSYQAIKHRLADVRIALDFARPLLFGAALADIPVSAAKVAATDAAHVAARTGLQVHGAIGYTAEFDLSLWLNRVRALGAAWGTPAWHRARVLDVIAGGHR
jgi:alkylation response protein AidB-like acyl-CoA dehydrogenase